MDSLEFTVAPSEPREQLSKRLDPDMPDRVRSQLRHGDSSLLTALSESNDDTGRVHVRVGFGPKSLLVEIEESEEVWAN
jgi:hypothetical protein